MKPADLTRRLRRLASRKGREIEIAEGGGHTKLRLNGKRTVIGRHPGDLKPGLTWAS